MAQQHILWSMVSIRAVVHCTKYSVCHSCCTLYKVWLLSQLLYFVQSMVPITAVAHYSLSLLSLQFPFSWFFFSLFIYVTCASRDVHAQYYICRCTLHMPSQAHTHNPALSGRVRFEKIYWDENSKLLM